MDTLTKPRRMSAISCFIRAADRGRIERIAGLHGESFSHVLRVIVARGLADVSRGPWQDDPAAVSATDERRRRGRTDAQ